MTEPVFLGTGTTLAFGTSLFVAELTDIAMDGIARPIIKTSHLATPPAGANEIGSDTFIPGKLSDPGALAITGHFPKNTIPPVEGAVEEIILTFPLLDTEATPTIWTFQGMMNDYAFGTPHEEKCPFTAAVKATGPITVTAST